jgi:hypothetical protein
MKTITPDMNIARQTRKADAAIAAATSDWERRYIEHVKGMFIASIEAGEPRPWSEFSPMIEEEWT